MHVCCLIPCLAIWSVRFGRASLLCVALFLPPSLLVQMTQCYIRRRRDRFSLTKSTSSCILCVSFAGCGTCLIACVFLDALKVFLQQHPTLHHPSSCTISFTLMRIQNPKRGVREFQPLLLSSDTLNGSSPATTLPPARQRFADFTWFSTTTLFPTAFLLCFVLIIVSGLLYLARVGATTHARLHMPL